MWVAVLLLVYGLGKDDWIDFLWQVVWESLNELGQGAYLLEVVMQVVSQSLNELVPEVHR